MMSRIDCFFLEVFVLEDFLEPFFIWDDFFLVISLNRYLDGEMLNFSIFYFSP